jgi:hypothetical protein
MKKEIHQVMPPGLQAKELHIQHMGKPGQRMPVACMKCGECPGHTLKGYSAPDMKVLCHILCIIKIDKFMILHLPINGKGCDNKEKAYKKFTGGMKRFKHYSRTTLI